MAIPAPQPEELVVRLGTPIAEANAAAVASMMQAVVAIVEEAQKQIKSNDEILVKARPFSEGSFEIPLELVLVGAALSFDNYPLIEHVLRLLKEYISIRKVLQGSPLPPAAKDGSIVVQGNITVTNSVVNILMNSQVNTAMDKVATDVKADTTIQSVKVLRGKEREPIATIERGELDYFRYDPNSAVLEGQKRDRPVQTTLIIHTPVLEGRGKWKFILDGRTVSADIKDEDFMQRVKAGNEVFAAGDRLVVDLIIHEEYAQSLATYQSKKHTIVKVYDHTMRPVNGVFDFDEDAT